ncbi:MAG: hypothetical protein ACLVKO_08990 [Dysgonomonas sp.]
MKKLFFYLLVLPFVFASCGDDDNNDYDDGKIELKNNSVVINSDQDNYKINARSKHAMTYESENDFIAWVDTAGVVNPVTIGETNIVIKSEKDMKKLKVTVKAVATLFPDPDMSWGTSRADMKKKYGTPKSEGESTIGYTDFSVAAPVVMYSFDSKDKLETSSVLVLGKHSAKLTDHLSERYLYFGESEGVLIFGNAYYKKDITLLVLVSVLDSDIMIVYAPVTPEDKKTATSASLLSSEFAKMFKNAGLVNSAGSPVNLDSLVKSVK